MQIGLFNRKNIKYIITIVIVGIFAVNQTYAQGTSCPTDMTAQVNQLLNILLSFLSRLWIPLATFAGKLMGNGFIYGEFINLDKVLYYLRNISRTFANFLIVGLLLKKIIQDSLGGKLNGGEIVKYVITKLTVGVILINISWFLVGAIIDISTIMTSAAASLPSTYIGSQGKDIRDTITKSIGSYKNGKPKQTINLSATLCDTKPISNITYSNSTDATAPLQSTDELLDKILPDENSVSGPLLYLGIGVIQVQNFLYNSNNPEAYIDNLFVISIRLAITATFIFSLVLLIVVNIFRLVSIWFAVAFGPILIVLLISGETALLGEYGKKFSPENIIKAIFSPVIAVGLMSIGLIVIVIMQSFLQINSGGVEWGDSYISSSAQGSRIGVQNVFETTIAGDILGKDSGDNIKNTFTNILLIVFTLFILFGITNLLSKFLSSGFGGKTIEKIGNFGKQIPGMISIPTAQGNISLSGAAKGVERMIERGSRKFDDGIKTQETLLENSIRQNFGLETTLLPEDYKTLTDLGYILNKKDRKVTANDLTSLKTNALEVIQKANYKQRPISISQMQGIGYSLTGLFHNISHYKIPLDTFGTGFGNTSLEIKEGESIEQFIANNYEKNKLFFNKIYDDLGGDSTKLTNGNDFRTGNMKWKK